MRAFSSGDSFTLMFGYVWMSCSLPHCEHVTAAVIDVAIEVLIFNIKCKITIFVELSEPTAERY